MNTRGLRKFRKTFQKLKIKFVNFHFAESKLPLYFAGGCFVLMESKQNRRFACVQTSNKAF